jgi:hypothetical protein
LQKKNRTKNVKQPIRGRVFKFALVYMENLWGGVRSTQTSMYTSLGPSVHQSEFPWTNDGGISSCPLFLSSLPSRLDFTYFCTYAREGCDVGPSPLRVASITREVLHHLPVIDSRGPPVRRDQIEQQGSKNVASELMYALLSALILTWK